MDTTGETKIKILADGPYEVCGDIGVNKAVFETDSQGNSLAWKVEKEYTKPGASTYLCRCGHSRAKPYCDGTHDDVGFCGGEKPEHSKYADRAEEYTGGGVDLHDDESLCVGARFCDVGETAWRYAQGSANPEWRARAVDECSKCPSGRLVVTEKDGKAIEPSLPKEVSVTSDPVANCRGPLWVKGGIPVEGPHGEQYEVRNRVTLCRCGESKNQPYCDASHYECECMKGMDE